MMRNIMVLTAVLMCGPAAFAQDGPTVIKPIGYDKPGATPPIKVNITGFTGEVNDVLNFDLFIMGFANVPADQAQFLITGSNNGNVQGTVTDRFNMQSKLNQTYSGGSLRRQAHALADDIVMATTGTKGHCPAHRRRLQDRVQNHHRFRERDSNGGL